MDYGTEEGKINRWSIIDHLAQSGVNYLLFYTQQTTIILIKYGRHHIRCKDHTSRATDVHGAKSFVFCVVFCRSLFVLLSFFLLPDDRVPSSDMPRIHCQKHCIYLSFIYRFVMAVHEHFTVSLTYINMLCYIQDHSIERVKGKRKCTHPFNSITLYIQGHLKKWVCDFLFSLIKTLWIEYLSVLCFLVLYLHRFNRFDIYTLQLLTFIRQIDLLFHWLYDYMLLVSITIPGLGRCMPYINLICKFSVTCCRSVVFRPIKPPQGYTCSLKYS